MSVVSQARNALGRARGFGGCYRCGGTWDYTDHHSTWYEDGQACFSLCETCWVGLGTPEDRLPYYEALRDSWVSQAQQRFDQDWLNEINEKWPKIVAAVEEGL